MIGRSPQLEPPFSTRRVLVCSHDRRVYDEVLEIGILAYLFEDARPNPMLRPPRKAPPNRVPLAEFRRQITPRRPSATQPQNRFDKAPIVLPVTTRIALLPRNERRNPLPLCIAQAMSLYHPRLPSSEASHDFAILNHEPVALGIARGVPESLCRTSKAVALGPIGPNVHST